MKFPVIYRQTILLIAYALKLCIHFLSIRHYDLCVCESLFNGFSGLHDPVFL